MSDDKNSNELSKWFSSYGVITAERLLEKYYLIFSHENLLELIEHPDCFYYSILRFPTKNVFNGIIIQQANDYLVYVQKLLVDYMLSGESAKPETSPGGLTRQDVETDRKHVVAMGEQFNQLQTNHKNIISDGQRYLIEFCRKWHDDFADTARSIHKAIPESSLTTIQEILDSVMIKHQKGSGDVEPDYKAMLLSIEELLGNSMGSDTSTIVKDYLMQTQNDISVASVKLKELINRSDDMNKEAKRFRSEFRNIIIDAYGLLQQLPDYEMDTNQITQYRLLITFDPELGDTVI